LPPAAEEPRQRHHETRSGQNAQPGPVAADLVVPEPRGDPEQQTGGGRCKQGRRCPSEPIHSIDLSPCVQVANLLAKTRRSERTPSFHDVKNAASRLCRSHSRLLKRSGVLLTSSSGGKARTPTVI